jgi:cell division transport system permease protein
LDYNPLPDTYEVRLAASESTKALVESLTKEIGGWREVDDVVYQKGMVESMEENLATFRMVLLIFGGLLLFVSVVLLRNTIRMSVYSRREIISTMKLVGANKGFIRRPFLINSVWMGVAAGALASILFFGALVGISKGFPYLMLSYGWQTMAVVCGAIVVSGVIISFVFTLLALNRFINMNSAKTNIY